MGEKKLGELTDVTAKKEALGTGAPINVRCHAVDKPWGDLTGTSGNPKSLFYTSSCSLFIYMTHAAWL